MEDLKYLESLIEELFYNQYYLNNMKYLSKWFRDQSTQLM